MADLHPVVSHLVGLKAKAAPVCRSPSSSLVTFLFPNSFTTELEDLMLMDQQNYY